jgi:hypothetical protein
VSLKAKAYEKKMEGRDGEGRRLKRGKGGEVMIGSVLPVVSQME